MLEYSAKDFFNKLLIAIMFAYIEVDFSLRKRLKIYQFYGVAKFWGELKESFNQDKDFKKPKIF